MANMKSSGVSGRILSSVTEKCDETLLDNNIEGCKG